jgi:hypothetical protein
MTNLQKLIEQILEGRTVSYEDSKLELLGDHEYSKKLKYYLNIK